MSICKGNGRYGNQIFRSLASSIIAHKFDLYIQYQNHEQIEELGFTLFVGNKTYANSKPLTDDNYLDIFNSKNLDYNITTNGYFQTHNISSIIHNYLSSDNISNSIMLNNKHKHRYKNNNDCFIHIRLGDQKAINPGFKYYDNILSKIKFDNLYIATDTTNHDIIKKLKNKYHQLNIYDTHLSDIIKFGSTCKYVILSYGTFSSIIGYMSYYSHVYCLEHCSKFAWDWNNKGEFNTFQNKYSKLGDWIVEKL